VQLSGTTPPPGAGPGKLDFTLEKTTATSVLYVHLIPSQFSVHSFYSVNVMILLTMAAAGNQCQILPEGPQWRCP
jgi:hypothetical protein